MKKLSFIRDSQKFSLLLQSHSCISVAYAASVIAELVRAEFKPRTYQLQLMSVYKPNLSKYVILSIGIPTS